MTRRRVHSIAQNEVVRRFVPVAEEYCELLESGTTRRKKLLRQIAELLPTLFDLAIHLPAGRQSERIRLELEGIGKDEWRWNPFKNNERRVARENQYGRTYISTKRFFVISKRLARIFGDLDSYREIFNPYEDKDSSQTTLSNDLAEIWHDVKPDLLLFKMGTEIAMQHAVYRSALAVRIHWGSGHFAGAMKAILYALADVDDDWQYPVFARRRIHF
ncbi:MAG TPA: DUF5063 domain-containing protein [Phycisphaerae bacterium]|nr:DUF5063 domain-containing protein [Phycisphaerae bacterium]